MASEEQEMLKRISALAGQINRHKTQQTAPVRQSNSQYHNSRVDNTSWRSNRGGYAPYPSRGRGFASRGKLIVPHRNRTLVLNGATGSQPEETSKSSDDLRASTPATSWVSKSDRHLQLINPAVYEKQSQERARAMEATRQRRLQHRDQRERTKFAKHLQHTATPNSTVSSNISAHNPTLPQFLFVNGIKFMVSNRGSKLIKVDGTENLGLSTPKTASVGGVIFHRSKSGNLYRSGVVKAQRYGPLWNKSRSTGWRMHINIDYVPYRRIGTIKKVDEPCKTFSTTGSCSKGPRCRYNHNASKLAICKEFMLKGSCSDGESCDLSHDLTPERTPTCLHFTKGNCTNPACRYVHVHVSPAAPACRAFGVYGYCDTGSACQERHMMSECPDYSNTGVCKIKGCKLIHRDRASIIRRHAAEAEAKGIEDGNSDLSSDEEEIDSDDVDSDDMEFFGDDDKDLDIPTQQDYVRL